MQIMLVAIVSLTACGRGSQPTSSSVETVDIAQTGVKDQGAFQNCWAYASTGLIESMYKMRTSRDIDLSEEALLFYRIAGHLLLLTQENPTHAKLKEAMAPISANDFQNFAVTSYGDEPNSAMTIIEKFGVVPESVWSMKVSSSTEVFAMIDAIKEALLSLSLVKGNTPITVEEILMQVMVAPGGFPSMPPSNFQFDGKLVSSQEFATSILNFDPKGMVSLAASDASGYERLIRGVKLALARGINVPIEFPEDRTRLNDYTYGDERGRGDFIFHGRHVVLVTDFVNKGGKLGYVPLDVLNAEVSRPGADLDYLYAKNSWGISTTTNPNNGRGVLEPGYYRLDQSYLRLILDHAVPTQVGPGSMLSIEEASKRRLAGVIVSIPVEILKELDDEQSSGPSL